MSAEIPYMLVAILDVLGYRERLEKDRQSGRFDFKDALQNAIEKLSNVNEAQYPYEAISDTIIFTSTNANDLAGLLSVLKSVYLAFLREGMLVRGGIPYERHFKSNNITYSHALALAHKVETEDAIYPRIVIESNLIGWQETENLWKNVIGSQLVCECNGIYFLNVLDADNWQQVYGWSKAIYENERTSLARKEKEFLKHSWLENYILTSPHSKPIAGFPRYLPAIKLPG
jgi:hypothetical protein